MVAGGEAHEARRYDESVQVTVTREKEVSIAFHTAKVLAERMGMIEMQEK